MALKFLENEAAFDPLLRPYRERADQVMLGMNGFLTLVCLALAPLHHTWIAAFGIGLPTLLLSFWLVRQFPAGLTTRLFNASSFMIYTGLIIHQNGGVTEAHFSAFGLIGVLLYYRDWRTIITATVGIYLHHLVFGYAQTLGAPIYVFASPNFWRMFVIHVIYFLPFVGMMSYLSIWLRQEGYGNQKDLQDLRQTKLKLQQLNESLEQRIEERTVDLKAAKALADSANQAKSEFLSNMSHELRTPLNGILGYAQILSRTPSLPPKQREGVDIIHQCGSHLLTLINDILDLSKIEARKLELLPTAVHLPSLLQSVVEIFNIRAEQRQIELAYRPSSRLPEGVMVDEKRLRQVLINLLGNAVKFTQLGSVALQVDLLSSSTTHVKLLFQVIDTGVGITEEDCAKLFQAFEQVGDRQKQVEGTGLGLAISQRIVQLMGGCIQVKSELGEGSEFFFTVELPLVENWPDQQRLGGDQDRIIGYGGDRCSILVVDDRWENRSVLANLLEPLGFDVIEAQNGEEGLETLRHRQLDLVITDIAMPVMDGFELIQHIRNVDELNRLQVIVSSASVSQVDQQKAIDQGGNHFLPKPVNTQVLFQILSECLDLDWRYETPANSVSSSESKPIEIVAPPAQTLKVLLEAAQQGRFMALREQIETLVDTDQAYTPFADSILHLAKQYRAEEIETLLQQYLTEGLVNAK